MSSSYGGLGVHNQSEDDLSLVDYQFTSKEYDEETGLYYMSARYMNPKTSRWISSDPAGWELINPTNNGGLIISSQNWYCYAENNPIVYHDPTGNIPFHVSFNKDSDSNQKFNGSGWGADAPQRWLGYYNGYDSIMNKAKFNIHATRFSGNKFTLRLWKGDYNWGGQAGGEIGIYNKFGGSYSRVRMFLGLGIKSTTMNVYNKNDGSFITGHTEENSSFWTNAFNGVDTPKEDMYMEAKFSFRNEEKAQEFYDQIYNSKDEAETYKYSGNESISIEYKGVKDVSIFWGKPEGAESK